MKKILSLVLVSLVIIVASQKDHDRAVEGASVIAHLDTSAYVNQTVLSSIVVDSGLDISYLSLVFAFEVDKFQSLNLISYYDDTSISVNGNCVTIELFRFNWPAGSTE